MADGVTDAKRRTATRDDVLAAGRDVLDEAGLDGLTMANVAARVGFTTMAVYRHVRNRDDLIAGAVDLVLGEIDGEDADVDWRDGVEAWMHDVRRCLLAHPWAAGQLGTPGGGSSVPWASTLQIVMRHIARSPLAPEDQARALAWTTRLTVGMLIIEIGAPMSQRPPGRPTGDRLADALASLRDDDLWADAVAQTRRFLESLSP